jgi:hypothetical protein
MTKGRAAFPFRFDAADGEQQVPPLRYAPVGMTLLFGGWDLIRRIREGRWAHCRSFGFAPPDFLWELMALSHFMRLSLQKGAHAALSSEAWQEIRVGMTRGRVAFPANRG